MYFCLHRPLVTCRQLSWSTCTWQWSIVQVLNTFRHTCSHKSVILISFFFCIRIVYWGIFFTQSFKGTYDTSAKTLGGGGSWKEIGSLSKTLNEKTGNCTLILYKTNGQRAVLNAYYAPFPLSTWDAYLLWSHRQFGGRSHCCLFCFFVN